MSFRDIHYDMGNDKLEKGAEANVSLFTEEDEALTAATYGIDAVFLAKTRVINNALKECGYGKYQWMLFASSGCVS